MKQLADLAGVSIRTLHYYDEIGLLKPRAIAENGYRLYDHQSVLRLQQIRFYRELDISLMAIRDLLNQPEFNVVESLQSHRVSLQTKAYRLDQLILTIDKTIAAMEGKIEMAPKEYFEGWTEEKQPEFEKEILQKYGEHALDDVIDWNSYSKEQKAAIIAEGGAITQALAGMMDKPVNSQEVQAGIARWHQHLKYFYDPSVERLRGLGQMYLDDPRFTATYENVRAGLALFMKQAIDVYCDGLEK